MIGRMKRNKIIMDLIIMVNRRMKVCNMYVWGVREIKNKRKRRAMKRGVIVRRRIRINRGIKNRRNLRITGKGKI